MTTSEPAARSGAFGAPLLLPPGHLTPPLPALSGRLHPLAAFQPLLSGLKYAAGLVPLWIFGVQEELRWIVPVSGLYVVSVVWGLVAAAIRYRTFRYAAEGRDLTLRWGLVARHTRVIPVRRVVNMVTRRSLWHRIFRAVELRIETAGGRGEDAVIEALAPRDVDLLRQRLRRLRDEASPATGPGGEPEVLRRLGPGRLVVHGLTSNMFAAFGAVVWFLWDNFGEALEERLAGLLETSWVFLAAAALLLLAWLGSVVLSLVRLWGFTLVRSRAGDLGTRYGLLTVHEGRLFTGKVQALVIAESLLRRPFRLASVSVLSAGGTAQQEDDKGGAELLLPLARREDVGGLVAQVFPELPRLPELRRVHPLAVRRNVVRLSVFPVALVLAAATQWTWPLVLLIPWAPLAYMLARARWACTGYATTDAFVLVRHGLVNRRTHVVPKAKLQTMTIRRNPFDRRLGLSSLSIDTAARSAIQAPRIPDVEPRVAHALRREIMEAAP